MQITGELIFINFFMRGPDGPRLVPDDIAWITQSLTCMKAYSKALFVVITHQQQLERGRVINSTLETKNEKNIHNVF